MIGVGMACEALFRPLFCAFGQRWRAKNRLNTFKRRKLFHRWMFFAFWRHFWVVSFGMPAISALLPGSDATAETTWSLIAQR
jgi:hypothetical protein